WVHRAAHILSNDEHHTATQVCQTYETLLTEMEHTPTPSETLATMLSSFRKVTTSYWPGLFHCYDHAELSQPGSHPDQRHDRGNTASHARVAIRLINMPGCACLSASLSLQLICNQRCKTCFPISYRFMGERKTTL